MRIELVACACALAPACIAPSVVASSGRAVAVAPEAIAWREATVDDVVGFFESEKIEGEAAASLSRVAYYFAADGFYTGAALVLGGAHPEYQTLTGTWRIASGKLVLDDGEPVTLDASEGRVRLTTPAGTLVLRRAALE